MVQKNLIILYSYQSPPLILIHFNHRRKVCLTWFETQVPYLYLNDSAPAMEPYSRGIKDNPSKIVSVSLTLILSAASTDNNFKSWPMDKVHNKIAPLYTQNPYGDNRLTVK